MNWGIKIPEPRKKIPEYNITHESQSHENDWINIFYIPIKIGNDKYLIPINRDLLIV